MRTLIDLTGGDADSAKNVQPSGYNPHRITEPPVDADAAAELVRLELADVATDLTMLRLQSDAGELTRNRLDETLARTARILRGLAAGFAVLGIAAAALLASPAPRAAATEAPEPDPVAVVAQPAASVVLDRQRVIVRLRVTTRNVTPAGRFCGSVWAGTSRGLQISGRACSYVPTFTIVAALDARYVPLGRSRLVVTDDVAPLTTTPATVTLTARRPSRFGRGVWTPTQYGDGLTVYAPLYAYTPAVGRWTPQQSSPVRVEERIAGRWVLRATATTNSRGIALVTVIIGGGPHTMRVRRLQGATVEPTAGTAHDFCLVPTDVPDGVI